MNSPIHPIEVLQAVTTGRWFGRWWLVIMLMMAMGRIDAATLYWHPQAVSTDGDLATNWTTDQAGTVRAGTINSTDTLQFNGGGTNHNNPCTLTAGLACGAIDFTGYTGIFDDGGFTLTVNGNTTFVSGMTYTTTGGLTIGATGTLTTGTKSIKNLTANTGTLTLGDALTVTDTATIGAAVANGGNLLTVNSTSTGSISGAVSGGGGITKDGNGLLTLSGPNSYAGSTIIIAGTVKIGNDSALGTTAAGTAIQSGATLDINGCNLGAEVVTISGTGVGGNGALINTGSSQPYALRYLVLAADATIGGSSSFDQRSNGGGEYLQLNSHVLTKVGTNQFSIIAIPTTTGFTSILVNRGTLGVQLATQLGAGTTGITVQSGATMQLWRSSGNTSAITLAGGTLDGDGWTNQGPSSWAGPITISGSGACTGHNGGGLQLSGGIGGTGNLTIGGYDPVVLTGTSNYSGSTTIVSGATLQLGDGTTNGSLTATSSITANGMLVFNPTGNQSFGIPVGGTGSVMKIGSNTLTLTSNYRFSVTPIIIYGGTLQNGAAGVLPDGCRVLVGSGAIWDLNGYAETVGSVNGSGTITLSGGTMTTGGDNTTTTYAGVISGNGGIVKAGTGTWTLANTNSYVGTTVVSGGSLRLANPLAHRWSFNNSLTDSVGGNSATITAGTTTHYSLSSNTVTIPGGAHAAADWVNLGTGLIPKDGSSFCVELWATEISIQNWSRIFDFGSGTTNYLMMSWTQGGTQATDRIEWLQSGLVKTTDNSMQPYALSPTGYHIALIVHPLSASSSLVEWYGATTASGTITGKTSWMIANATLANLTDTNLMLGQSHWGADNVANASYDEVRFWNSSLPLSVLNSFQGAGPDSLTGACSGSLPSTSAVTLSGTATLDLNGLTQTIGSLTGVSGTTVHLGSGALTSGGDGISTTFAGVIVDTGGVTKSGAGIWTLTGTNTYTGTTTVTGGVLRGTGSISTGGVTVSGGTIAGGTSGADGTFTVGGGAVNLSAGTMTTRIGGYAAGSTFDQVAGASSALTLGGSSVLNLDLTGLASTGTATGIITCSGLPTGIFSSVAISNNTNNYNVALQYVSGGVNAVISQGGATLYWHPQAASTNGNLATNWTTDQTGLVRAASINSTDTLKFNGSGTNATNACTLSAGLACGAIDFTGYTGTFSDGGFTLTVNGNTTFVSGMTYTTTGGLTLGASGTLTTGTKSLNNLTANTGTLTLGDALTVTGTATIGAAVTNAGFLITITNASGTSTISGAVSGAGAITKSGNGALTLNGLNGYTGTTSIQAGTLSINTIKSVGGGNSAVGAPTTIANGTIAMGNSTTTGTLIYTGTGNTTDRVIDLAGTTGGAVLDQSGTGLLKFTSPFTATGVGAKTLTLQGSTAGSGEIGGAIVNSSSGATALTKTGIGMWTLSGTNSYTGVTTISGGTLAIGNGTTDGSIATSSAITDNGTLAFNLVGNQTNSMMISGTGALTKSGAGTLTLSGANTYTGATTVSTGVLSISSSGSLGNTAITITNGGVFAPNPGSGTIAVGSTATAAAGATLALTSGAVCDLTDGAVGTCTLQQGASFAGAALTISDATLNVDIDSSGADKLASTKAASVSGINSIGLTGVGSLLTVAGAYDVITAPSGLNGGTWQFTGGGTSRLLSVGANTYTMTLTNSDSAVTVMVLSSSPINIWNGGTTANWNLPGNWSLIHVPTPSEDVQIGNGAGSNSTAPSVNVAGCTCHSITFLGTASTIGAGTGTLTIAAGITAGITGCTIACPVALGASQTWDTGAHTLTVSGAISGAFGLTKAGSGTLTLSSASSSYTGATTINAGIISVSTLANGGSTSGIGASTNAATNLVLNGGTLTYTGAATSTDRLFSVDSSDGTIDASGSGALAFTNTGTISFNGTTGTRILNLIGSNTGTNTMSVVIADNGGATSIIKRDAGVWALTATNLCTGAVLINAGTLSIGDGTTDGSIASTSGITDNATLTYNLVGSRTYTNVISGSGTLIKTGAGTLTLTGINTLTGAVTISAGTLSLGDGITDGSIATSSGITDNGTLIYNLIGSRSYTKIIGGSGALTKTGAGTLTLTNATNSYTGATTINGGMLSVSTLANGGSTSGIGAATNVATNLVLDGGTLHYTGAAVSTDRLFSVGGNGGTIDSSGSGAVNFTNTGNLGFNGATSARTVTLTGTNTGINRLATVISDHTGVTTVSKTGTGTWNLAGANSYTGATTVSVGTLLVTGSTVSGSAVSVASGATLGGTGTVAGAVAIADGGIIAPGSGGTTTNTLTTGVLTLNASSVYSVDLNGTGPINDAIVASGVTANLNGTLTIASASNASPGVTYTIVTAGTVIGTFSGLPDGSDFAQGGHTYRIAYTGPTVTLTELGPPVIVSRQTLDTDSNGMIDRIRLTFDQNLNDNVSGLTVTVGGVPYTTGAQFSTGTTHDRVLDVLLTESGSPDTGATPTVQMTANTSLASLSGNTLIATELSTTNATDSAPPVLMSTTWTDVGSDGVNAGDTIALTFSEPVTTSGMVVVDLGLPVSGDTLSTSTIANQSGSTITVTLAGTPLLTPGGVYASGALGAGNPSGIYLASNAHVVDQATSPLNAITGTPSLAVDVRPGTARTLSAAWVTETNPKSWALGTVTTAATRNTVTDFCDLRIRNTGNGAVQMVIASSASSPSGWAPDTAAGTNRYLMKCDNTGAASSGATNAANYALTLSTTPQTLAAQLYSGCITDFALWLQAPTAITVGGGLPQAITVTVTVQLAP